MINVWKRHTTHKNVQKSMAKGLDVSGNHILELLENKRMKKQKKKAAAVAAA